MKRIIKNLGFMIMMLSIAFIYHTKVEAATTGTFNGYTYSVEDGSNEATITGYTGTETDLSIPSNIGEYKVTAIGEDAFYLKKLTSVILPDTLKTLYWRALYGTNITQLILPASVEHVYLNAIAGNVKLELLTVLSSTTQIDEKAGNEAFWGSDERKLKIFCKPESYTSDFAENAGYNYYYLDEYNPSSIAFSNPTLTLNVGEEYTLGKDDFIVSPSTAYIIDPTNFTTSDNYIAYIDNGVLKARNEGTVTINATISDEHLENDVTTTIPLTVNVVESRKKVDSVNITLDGVSVHDKFINKTKGDYSYIDIKNIIVMYKGESIKLDASIKPINAIYTGEWTTVDNIISINKNGLLTALETGTAQVIYSTSSSFGNVNESNSNYVMIWVDEKPNNENPTNPSEPTIPTDPTTPTTPTNPATPTNPTNPETPTTQVGKITLTASKIDLQKGKTIKTLELKTNQLEGDRIANVVSSNKKVLKATLKGQTISLKGLKTSSKYVTVTVNMTSGAKATCKVRVVGNEVKTKKLSISDKKLSLLKGESKKLTITRNPISATDKITWKSSNTKVATVDKNGKVKTKSAGKATITATSASGKKVTCKVTVSNVLNADTINIQKGKTIKTLAVTARQLKGDSIASVKSSNSKVLKVSLDGQTIVLKGLKTSSKYVTVTVKMASGAKGTCKVKVVKSKVKTQKLGLTDKKLSLKAGESSQLEAVRNPISAMDKITWKSSNKKVATIDKDGNIVAIKKGKTTITATVNGKKATCKVTVK
ncbi:MAG: Ig-like domain-containing protein [Candidatus Galacturonibacter soehngenii]|nr:Ig-like domain-containing protein [Candidatus Galacturonibacter soehngenii]